MTLSSGPKPHPGIHLSLPVFHRPIPCVQEPAGFQMPVRMRVKTLFRLEAQIVAQNIVERSRI